MLEVVVAQSGDPAKRPSKPFHFLQRRHVSPSRRLRSVFCRFLFIIDRQKSSRAAGSLVSGWRPPTAIPGVSRMSAPLEMERGCDARPNRASDAADEADEPVAAMAHGAARDHRSVEAVAEGEQRRRAIALAVATPRRTSAVLAWQARL